MEALWNAVEHLHRRQPVVLVHGGGPQLTEMARKLGHEPAIVQGRRITTDLDLSIMHWTVCGELNTRLVAQAASHGLNGVGLSGIDGGILQVRKRPPWTIDNQVIDFGWVGDVLHIKTDLLQLLIDTGHIPILAPLGIDERGQTYNVNADTVSLSIATALRAGTYFLVTESGGVRRNSDDSTSILPVIDRALHDEGVAAGWISDGMIVKLKVAFEAREAGIPAVHVASPGDLYPQPGGTRIT